MPQIASLLANVDGDNSGLTSTLRRTDVATRAHVAQMGRHFRRLRLITVASVTAITLGLARGITGIVAYGDEIAKSARTAGTSVRQYDALRFALEQFGIESAQTNNILVNLSNAISQAGLGILNYQRQFQLLNLDIRDFSSTDQVSNLRTVLTALRDVDSEVSRLSTASIIFGRRFARELGTAIAEGGDELLRLEELGVRIGAVLTNEAAAGAEYLRDRFNELSRTIRNNFYSGVLETFNSLIPDTASWHLVLQEVGETVRAITSSFVSMIFHFQAHSRFYIGLSTVLGTIFGLWVLIRAVVVAYRTAIIAANAALLATYPLLIGIAGLWAGITGGAAFLARIGWSAIFSQVARLGNYLQKVFAPILAFFASIRAGFSRTFRHGDEILRTSQANEGQAAQNIQEVQRRLRQAQERARTGTSLGRGLAQMEVREQRESLKTFKEIRESARKNLLSAEEMRKSLNRMSSSISHVAKVVRRSIPKAGEYLKKSMNAASNSASDFAKNVRNSIKNAPASALDFAKKLRASITPTVLRSFARGLIQGIGALIISIVATLFGNALAQSFEKAVVDFMDRVYSSILSTLGFNRQIERQPWRQWIEEYREGQDTPEEQEEQKKEQREMLQGTVAQNKNTKATEQLKAQVEKNTEAVEENTEQQSNSFESELGQNVSRMLTQISQWIGNTTGELGLGELAGDTATAAFRPFYDFIEGIGDTVITPPSDLTRARVTAATERERQIAEYRRMLAETPSADFPLGHSFSDTNVEGGTQRITSFNSHIPGLQRQLDQHMTKYIRDLEEFPQRIADASITSAQQFEENMTQFFWEQGMSAVTKEQRELYKERQDIFDKHLREQRDQTVRGLGDPLQLDGSPRVSRNHDVLGLLSTIRGDTGQPYQSVQPRTTEVGLGQAVSQDVEKLMKEHNRRFLYQIKEFVRRGVIRPDPTGKYENIRYNDFTDDSQDYAIEAIRDWREILLKFNSTSNEIESYARNLFGIAANVDSKSVELRDYVRQQLTPNADFNALDVEQRRNIDKKVADYIEMLAKEARDRFTPAEMAKLIDSAGSKFVKGATALAKKQQEVIDEISKGRRAGGVDQFTWSQMTETERKRYLNNQGSSLGIDFTRRHKYMSEEDIDRMLAAKVAPLAKTILEKLDETFKADGFKLLSEEQEAALEKLRQQQQPYLDMVKSHGDQLGSTFADALLRWDDDGLRERLRNAIRRPFIDLFGNFFSEWIGKQLKSMIQGLFVGKQDGLGFFGSIGALFKGNFAKGAGKGIDTGSGGLAWLSGLSKRHSGGMVPGAYPMEVPMMLRSGEMVLNPGQQRNLFKMAQNGSGEGGLTINNKTEIVGNVDIQTRQAIRDQNRELSKMIEADFRRRRVIA